MLTDIKLKEAPHTAKNTRKGREEKEEENDITNEIYNYILEEKWIIERDYILIFNDFKIDIFNEIKQK